MTQFDLDAQAALTEAIGAYAPNLHAPTGIDAVALLRALAAQEVGNASRSLACRHESSYCYGGKYHTDAVKQAEWRYGCAAHCSWGPWQIMYPTATMRGYTGDPVGLRDPMVSGEYVVSQINYRVFDMIVRPTLNDVFDAWNSGTARDGLVPAVYIEQAMAHYVRFAGSGDAAA
jgi:hypothetical protein